MKSLRKGIGNSKDVEIFYDKWSNSYDQTLSNWNYKAPKQSVNILKKFIKKKPRYLLDLACGTGLFVKEYLKTYQKEGMLLFSSLLTQGMIILKG